MELHREVAKLITAGSKLKATAATAGPSSSTSIVSRVYNSYVKPYLFKYFQAPVERWNYAMASRYLRQHGMMLDDFYHLQEPVIERAVSLLPPDLAAARYRRIMRGQHLNFLRLYLPLEEQNYDPFLPYLAPYIEEAKFQIQEEIELLGYHPYDRRIFSGGSLGFSNTRKDTFKALAPSQLSYTGGRH